MAAHVLSLCRISYFQLRQLRPVARSLSAEAAKSLVQTFISRCLDYCNAVLSGIGDILLGRLQPIPNAAVRLLTGARRRDHISPVLKQLHWLPVRFRVEYKLAYLVFKPNFAIPGGGMSAHRPRRWELSSSFCQRQYLRQRHHRPEDQYSIGRQKFLCR